MRRPLLAAAASASAASNAACHTTRHPAKTTPATTVTLITSAACAGSGVRVVSASPNSTRLTRAHAAPLQIGVRRVPDGIVDRLTA